MYALFENVAQLTWMLHSLNWNITPTLPSTTLYQVMMQNLMAPQGKYLVIELMFGYVSLTPANNNNSELK